MADVIFQSLTRRNEIGANCYIIESGGSRVALDSGMHPKEKAFESLPDFQLIDDDTLDAAIITHSHLDHVGGLPVLLRRHPKARACMTEMTAEFAEALLHNSVNVMGHQREQENIPEYPLFTHREVDSQRSRWTVREPGRAFEIGDTGMRAEFFEAGHLPGSVGVRLEVDGLRVFYTGDVNFEDQSLQTAARFPEEHVDVLIMECTRGGRERAPGYTREGEMRRLAECVTRTVNRGGSVLIPVFALGKTQEILIMLTEMRRSGLIPRDVPVQIGGLGTRMTQIVDRFSDRGGRRYAGFRILQSMPGLIQAKKGERPTGSAPGRIYALSSGMMSENTVSNDFAFHFIDKPQNSICFVGYADPDSPAGAILAARPGDLVKLHPSYAPVPLKAEVQSFDFSGHAPREALVDYARKLAPKKILLVHGDGPALDWMAAELSRVLPETEVIIPLPGERLVLN